MSIEAENLDVIAHPISHQFLSHSTEKNCSIFKNSFLVIPLICLNSPPHTNLSQTDTETYENFFFHLLIKFTWYAMQIFIIPRYNDNIQH